MDKRLGAGWLFLGVFLLYALAFVFSMRRTNYYLTGDQVYYLVMAASIWEDGDLDLSDEYRDQVYRDFYPQPLTETDIEGHHLSGRDGGLYSRHGAGLPLLIAPAWALGRQVGVNLWLIALAAILATQLAGMMYDLLPAGRVVCWAWIGIVLSPPLILYNPLLFTELPAALALTFALRYGFLLPRERKGYQWALVLLGALFLPWLNPRYALLVLPLAAALWIRGRRRMGLAAAAGVVLPFVHFWLLLGYLPTLGDYGRVSLATLPAGLPGLWLDREAGLLPYAPLYALALYGALQATHKWAVAWRPWLWVWLPYFLFLCCYDHWFGGWNPPARMMVPLIPFLVPLVALALAEMVPRWGRVVAALLGTAGAAAGILLLAHPLMQYNELQGSSKLFDFISGRTGLNPSLLWPSLINPSWVSYAQVGVIVACLAAGYFLLYRSKN